MRTITIALTMALIALPVLAQTQTDWCASPTASDDQTIAGCSVLIQAGRETPTQLSADYDNRAYAYNNKQLYDLALADENKAVTLNPASANSHSLRGLTYLDKGLNDLAIADFNQAITLKPNSEGAGDNFNAYNDRGLAYAHKAQYDQALADYNQALALEPDNPHALYNRGLTYEKTGHRDLALADLRRAAALDPGETSIAAALARVSAAP